MRFPTPLMRGHLVRRWNRFLSEVELDGQVVRAHCPNPGTMMGLNAPGTPVWIEPNDDPKRKLKYGWRLVELGDGQFAGIDTAVPNRVVGEALRARAIPELSGYDIVRAEVNYGRQSRVDYLLTGGGPDTYVEVKNVHLRRGPPIAEFPDCVTTRGARHLDELADMVAAGHRAVMLYLIQRTDCGDGFRLARDLDPAYGAAFDRARAAGVDAIAYDTDISPDGVVLRRSVPILPV